ncbi:MAG: DUF4416 family protein [Candidatus Omnitrophica bacterium]|nr:DUF4416 family protein [Candidatus Omnitrophota bacterium]MDD5691079.1 DUF4416 family protein [Candidatus Omnitrophota bacterium]
MALAVSKSRHGLSIHLGKARKYNHKVKLIMGFIYKDEAIFIKVRDKLKRKFGRIDFQPGPLDFNSTDYYKKEMGPGLKRRFISFSKLILMQDLYRIKLYTNRLEAEFLASSGERQVNIDPGYLDLAKLVLASTKDYAHRIYLRKGVFAEVTLNYRGNSFSPNDWTYPDYRSHEYADIFNKIRGLYIP